MTGVSLSCLSIFIARSLHTSTTETTIYVPSFASSPPVNHRSIRLDRISTKSLPKNSPQPQLPPLIDVLTNGKEKVNVATSPVLLLPYTIILDNDEPESTDVSVPITSWINELSTEIVGNLSPCDTDFPDLDDFLAVADILTGTSGTNHQFSKNVLQSEDKDYMCDITEVLGGILWVLMNHYNGLREVTDWMDLYKILLPQVDLSSFSKKKYEDILHPKTFPQLVSKTILLFQSLTPVRFAIVDGQCRISSILHCLLQTHPFLPQNMQPPKLTFTNFKSTPAPVYSSSPPDGFLQRLRVQTTVSFFLPHQNDQYLFDQRMIRIFKRLSDEIQGSHERGTRKSLVDAILNCLSIELSSFPINAKTEQGLFKQLRAKRKFVMDKLFDADNEMVTTWKETIRSMGKPSIPVAVPINSDHGMDKYEVSIPNKKFPNFNIKRLGPPSDFLATVLLLAQCTDSPQSIIDLQECIKTGFAGHNTSPKRALSQLLYKLPDNHLSTFVPTTLNDASSQIPPVKVSILLETF
jgi:hypothetical protein